MFLFLKHLYIISFGLHHHPDSFTDPLAEGVCRERPRERDRSRPHERRHHSSAGEKQRYYSCERYGSRQQCHTRSAGPSRSTSPGEGHENVFLKQVRLPVSLCPSVLLLGQYVLLTNRICKTCHARPPLLCVLR